MTHGPSGARQIERRSLQIGVTASLVMAVMQGPLEVCPQ